MDRPCGRNNGIQLARSSLNSSTDRWKLSPEPMGREFMADVCADRHQRGGQAAETLAFGELDACGVDGGGQDGAGAGLAVHLLGRQLLRAVAAGGHSRRWVGRTCGSWGSTNRAAGRRVRKLPQEGAALGLQGGEIGGPRQGERLSNASRQSLHLETQPRPSVSTGLPFNLKRINLMLYTQVRRGESAAKRRDDSEDAGSTSSGPEIR